MVLGALDIELVGVEVMVGAAVLLPPTSLSVRGGECVALVGPSGSGKSTLIACVAGLRMATAGQVLVEGLSLAEMTASERSSMRRSRMGMVFQDADLLDELDVQSNVALRLVFDGVRRPRALRAAEDLLRQLGLGDLSRAAVGSLSGGEAQRVAVARALIGSPSVVVADEPTASLDAANAEAVTALLIEAARAGAAVLLATHDPAVAGMCDRVHDLRAGRSA